MGKLLLATASLAVVATAASGGYCAPMRRDAPQAIPKIPGKQCPSGWASSAHSCTEMRRPK